MFPTSRVRSLFPSSLRLALKFFSHFSSLVRFSFYLDARTAFSIVRIGMEIASFFFLLIAIVIPLMCHKTSYASEYGILFKHSAIQGKSTNNKALH